MSIEYQVIFSGKVKNEAARDQVAHKIAQALKKDESFCEVLLSGKPIILRRSKNLNQAKHTIAQLEKIGALAEIVGHTTGNGLIPKRVGESGNRVRRMPRVSQGPIFKQDENSSQAVPPALRKILQYKFDTFMAKGSSSSFKALLFVFVAIFLIIAGLRGVLYTVNPELVQQYESLDVLGNIYITFLQLTDPGNMAQDILSSAWYKLFSVLAGVAGIIILSALIAVITTALDQKLSELKRGRSKVMEEGHTLIIGWDEQRITEMLRELVIANESEKDACVVILADLDKQMMDDVLRLRIPDTKTTRVVTRSGKGTIIANLDMVSLEAAKSVIVLAGGADADVNVCQSNADAQIIQTVLAVTTKSVDKEDYAIVAEVRNAEYRNIIEYTFPEYVVTLDTENILAKLLVQTSRSVGLSVVYNEILSFDGCEIYFYEADWNDTPFGRLVYHFPDGVPIGVRHQNGELLINPAPDYVMRDDDEIVIIAGDDSTIEFQAAPLADPPAYPSLNARGTQRAEQELIIGWNDKTETILREFSDYVIEGSKIDIVVYNASGTEIDEVSRINAEVENIDINLIDINPLDRNALLELDLGKYENIIILASNRGQTPAQQVDSENIVTLLLIRSIFQELEQQDGETKLITEVLESQNHALIAKAGVKDVIISNRLISMIIAQISESRGIKDVYDDIFQEEGSEIYLKPVSLYFDHLPVSLSFADLISAAQSRGEICFGVKLKQLEADQTRNSGVELIPPKSKVFELKHDDCLVVVAEDEL